MSCVSKSDGGTSLLILEVHTPSEGIEGNPQSKVQNPGFAGRGFVDRTGQDG